MKPEIRAAAELRFEPYDDPRDGIGALHGIALKYGDQTRLPDGRLERFEPRALRVEHLVLNHEHDRDVPLAFYPGGGLELRHDDHALAFVARLPDTRLGRRAVADVRSGKLKGASVEFHSREERSERQTRVIALADLVGMALTYGPAYPGSRVEVRRKHRSLIRWL